MFTIDAHLDLATNAITLNRDLMKPVHVLREKEKQLQWKDTQDRGNGTVALPELRKGNVGLVVATIISRYSAAGNPLASVYMVNAFKFFKGAWEQYLKPALEAIWSFVKTYIIPIFDALSSKIGGIQGIIQGIASFISSLAEAAKKIPAWLIPGSPTPFEMGLRGITDALKELNGVSANFNFSSGEGIFERQYNQQFQYERAYKRGVQHGHA